MHKFFLGFLAAIVFFAFAGFLALRNGWLDPSADAPVNTLEQKLAMPALDASVKQRAPALKNPIDPNDANLIAGMKIYQANCATCHGDIQRPHGTFVNALYPRAPEFLNDAPDMPENQNFYIIQHGIRLSAMPAWKRLLSEQQIWLVTTFLSHMHKLPAQVSDEWKAEAAGRR